MTDAQETIGTVLLMGAPLAVIVWPWLPTGVIDAAAGAGLDVRLSVMAFLSTPWSYGFYVGITGRL